MKMLLIIFCAFGLVNPAFADRAGNGGDGIWMGKGNERKLYVADLAEFDLHINPNLSPNTKTESFIEQRITAALGNQYPTALISRKLSAVFEVSKQIAGHILVAIESLNWRLMSRDLENIPDFESVIGFPKEDIVQLAIRRSMEVHLDKKLFQQLDEANQAGLVFHEALYASVPLRFTEECSSGACISYYYQDSYDARRIVSYLFSDDLHRKGYRGLKITTDSSGYFLADKDMGRYSEKMERIIYSERILVTNPAAAKFLFSDSTEQDIDEAIHGGCLKTFGSVEHQTLYHVYQPLDFQTKDLTHFKNTDELRLIRNMMLSVGDDTVREKYNRAQWPSKNVRQWYPGIKLEHLKFERPESSCRRQLKPILLDYLKMMLQ